MGTSLYGLTPSGTYPGLIKTGDNTAISGTLKTLSDGSGNNLPMEASTSTINFTGALQQSGVAVPTASQVNAKQDTLVSGTNIKTINGTSVLGSGNIVTPSTSPSGSAGYIQFSNGSAFASDANLFWDNTNKRLGIGTNAPAHTLSIETGSTFSGLSITSSNNSPRILLNGIGGGYGIIQNITGPLYIDTQVGNKLISRGGGIQINGQGSTSATTSLLVQNSSGTQLFSINDAGQFQFNGNTLFGIGTAFAMATATGYINTSTNSYSVMATNASTGNAKFYQSVSIGTSSDPVASSVLELVSTTKGFLPPRMTTAQKNAISSPASGLVVYDTTTNKLCCYNGTSWNDLF